MIYVVGEKQGRGGTRRRLAELMGTTVPEMMDSVVWINLWEIDGQRSSRLVEMVERCARRGDAVLMLGRRVAEAFGRSDVKSLEWVRPQMFGPSIWAIPHPSGLNRWWNDQTNTYRAEIILRSIWNGYREED